MNSWPNGYRHAMTQSEHASWNASHDPGTRQICDRCNKPTGRCEEDTFWNDLGEHLCDECLREQEGK